MNKAEFLNELNIALGVLSQEDRAEIILDFEEHFEIGLTEGKSEEEITGALGSPQVIALEMTGGQKSVPQKEPTSNMIRMVCIGIVVVFFNLTIAIGPIIAVVGILIGGITTAIAFSLAPLIILLNLFIDFENLGLFNFFISLSLSGLGLFLSIGMYYVIKWFVWAMVRYVEFNIKLIKGGVNND